MGSRRIDELVPELQEKYYAFEKEMQAAGIDFIVTCTYRSQEEQDKLYAQGRTEPGMIVTWARSSLHTQKKAFDIAIMVNGKINWGNKAYEVPGLLGEKVGLKWGGRFKDSKGRPKPDRPHFQLA